ncbi:MAG: hypothetical protein R2792_20295 [Saprospiraceae bacterium]
MNCEIKHATSEALVSGGFIKLKKNLVHLKIIPVMKKVVFLLTFFFALGMAATATAQCQGSKSASATKSCCMNKAAKAASSDASIEERVADNGSVSYVRKEADAEGNVRFVSVKFDESSNTFVNEAPKTVSASATSGMTKKSCASSEGKACCAGKAETKACCAGKSSGKACAGSAKVEQK